MNPYLAGVGLGLVLLASFVIMGRGLGASGAFSSMVAFAVDTVAPAHAQANDFYRGYLESVDHPLKSWLVFLIVGVMVGGFVSGALGGRIRRTIEKGPNVSARTRLLLAFGGGMLIGVGAKLARGCTSGQALSGGALLNAGSWAFMLMVFAGGYALAYFVRRQWR
ncbi:MAG: YeeE/YedE family protein [bacterium]|nr:YeeE/YedE family protein [bacterium]